MKFDSATMLLVNQMESDAQIIRDALICFEKKVNSYMVGKDKLKELSENRRMKQARRRLKEAVNASVSTLLQIQLAKEEGIKDDAED